MEETGKLVEEAKEEVFSSPENETLVDGVVTEDQTSVVPAINEEAVMAVQVEEPKEAFAAEAKENAEGSNSEIGSGAFAQQRAAWSNGWSI